MSTKTQGTHLFALMPDNSIVRVVCVTGLNYSGGDRGVKPSVCLDDDDAIDQPGDLAAGTLSPAVNINLEDPGHVALWNLHQQKEGTMLRWFVGKSGSTAAPTVVEDEVVLPPERGWIPFFGFIKTFPLDVQSRSDYVGTMQIHLSGLSPYIAAEEPEPEDPEGD